MDDFLHLPPHGRIIIVQVWLVAEEAMPVIGPGFYIPTPVGTLRIREDNTSILIFLCRFAPDIVVAIARAWRLARLLKPGVLIGRMIHHQICDDPNTPMVSRFENRLEISQCARSEE